MSVEIRPAEPGEAKEILCLVNADFARHGFPGPANPTEKEILDLARKIETDIVTNRVVALGAAGIVAYAKYGPWSAANENQFTTGWVARQFNALNEYPNETGLHTLAVHEAEPDGYRGEAVTTLLGSTGVFAVQFGDTLKIPVAGVDYPEMDDFKEFLASRGATPTGRMGEIVVSGILKKVRAELWIKQGPVL